MKFNKAHDAEHRFERIRGKWAGTPARRLFVGMVCI
jgi:hypothetical protein